MKTVHDARWTTRDRNAVVFHALTLSILVFVPSAQADPVMATHDGCVTALPATEATWTSTRHFQFVASWDPVPGCEPTIAHAMVLHEWLEDFDGSGGLMVKTVMDWFPKCGRIQFDAQSYVSADSNILDEMGLVSLVFDTGVDCASVEGLSPGPTPTPQEVPEPPVIALLASGAAVLGIIFVPEAASRPNTPGRRLRRRSHRSAR